MQKPGKAKPWWQRGGYSSPAAYKASRRRSDLKYKYGLTEEEYQQMLKAQRGRCAICRDTTPGAGQALFYVDHCHASEKVRGLLCHKCNTGLSNFKDKKHLLGRAIKYLQGYLTKKFHSTILKRRGKG